MIVKTDTLPTRTVTPVAIDLEMFGQEKKRLHIPHGQFASLQIYDGTTCYVITKEEMIEPALKQVEDSLWIFHNAAYDVRQLRRFVDIPPRDDLWDTFLVEKLMYSGYYDTFGLKDLVRRYFSLYMDKTIREGFGTSKKLTDEMLQYAAMDAVYTYDIYWKQKDIISDNLLQVWDRIDLPVLWAVLDFKPVKIDRENWVELAAKCETKGRDIENEIGMNVFSYKKVLEYLQVEHALNIDDTAADTLAPYAENIPIVAKILEARGWRKASSTYGQGWLDKHANEDDIVVSEFVTIGTETGRFASRNPNLQNIPSRKMPEYRDLFISQHGRIIVADISQQETAIVAAMSGDKGLLGAVNSGEDTHIGTARTMYHDDALTKEADKDKRAAGKVVNLAIPYGMSASGLVAKLKIDANMEVDEKEAQEFLDSYFRKYPGVSRHINLCQRLAYKNEYVETTMGRKIWVNLYDNQWERNAINAPIQGGAADFTKMWIADFWKTCGIREIYYPIVMVIHDEIVLDVDEKDVDLYSDILMESFERTNLRTYPEVTMRLEILSGESWGCK
jgi:DNA polymerase I-like protein with 3'-5' exonuclease and polymerase domains